MKLAVAGRAVVTLFALSTIGAPAQGQATDVGELLMWGPGAAGAFAPPSNLGPIVDVWATNTAVVAMRADGSLVGWGPDFVASNPPPPLHMM